MAILLEIVIPCIGIDERHSLEEALDGALEPLGLGEVTGGGSGASSSNIDVETSDDVAATEVISRVLRAHHVEPLKIVRRLPPAEQDDDRAFVEQAIRRGEREGLWALPAAEQIVYVISEAEVRCDMDGIDSFVDAYGAPGLALLAEAYAAVGAERLASSLRVVATVLPDSTHPALQQTNDLITSRDGYSYASIVAAARARSGEGSGGTR